MVVSAWSQQHPNDNNLQWCWVTKCLSQFSSYLVLRREVKLLEELGRDGDATCCLDFAKSSAGVVIGIEVLMITIAVA